MLEVDTPEDLDAHVGRTLDAGEWLTVTQAMIDMFAAATGDHQWIHVDPERARTGLPGGKTIAHGFLTLSLLPALNATVYTVRRRSRSINYGSNKVRFTSPVPVGARVRSSVRLLVCEPIEGGRRVIAGATIQIEGQDRPALVAETITLIYA